MISPAWQRAFLGMSAILGEPLDASLGALDLTLAIDATSARVDGAGARAAGVPSPSPPGRRHSNDGIRYVEELLPALRSPSREVRARAIAGALAAVLVGLDELRLG
jgi:hypothetical protein